VVKAGTWSKLLETRNKRLVFAIALSLILSSIFIILLVRILHIFILTIILYLLIVELSVFPHIRKKTIVHLNSYLEKLRREVLELLIGNPASLFILS